MPQHEASDRRSGFSTRRPWLRRIPHPDVHARSRIRTCDLWLRRPALYPLSYARLQPILEGRASRPPSGTPAVSAVKMHRHGPLRAFLGTAGSMPTVQRAPSCLLIRRGGDRILIDCGEGSAASAAALGRPAGHRAHLPHPLPRRPLPRPAGNAEDVRAARTRGAAHRLRAARARRPDVGPAPDLREAQLRARIVELGAGEAVEFDDYRIGAFAVEHTDEAVGYALVEDDRPAASTRDARELGVPAGPAVRCAPARGAGRGGRARRSSPRR